MAQKEIPRKPPAIVHIIWKYYKKTDPKTSNIISKAKSKRFSDTGNSFVAGDGLLVLTKLENACFVTLEHKTINEDHFHVKVKRTQNIHSLSSRPFGANIEKKNNWHQTFMWERTALARGTVPWSHKVSVLKSAQVVRANSKYLTCIPYCLTPVSLEYLQSQQTHLEKICKLTVCDWALCFSVSAPLIRLVSA